jgi:hypothetical protein
MRWSGGALRMAPGTLAKDYATSRAIQNYDVLSRFPNRLSFAARAHLSTTSPPLSALDCDKTLQRTAADRLSRFVLVSKGLCFHPWLGDTESPVHKRPTVFPFRLLYPHLHHGLLNINNRNLSCR